MKIYIDEREHNLYHYLQTKSPLNNSINKAVLPLGDIILKTNDDIELIIIERKTISDLLSSIKDGRYKEQSHRLIHSSSIHTHRIIYLIEGLLQNESSQEKQMFYSSIVSLNQIKGFSIMRTWCLEETGDVILNLSDKLQREMDKGNFIAIQEVTNSIKEPEKYCSIVKKVKKDNITPENMGEIILCQIPGISSVNAIAIMKEFKSISEFIDKIKSEPQFLENFLYESNGKKKKLNKNIIGNIYKYLVIV